MRSQSGNIALFACFALGILAVGGGIYWAYSGETSVKVVDFRAAFEQTKARVEGALSNQATLNASVERNPNPFACLYASNGDCSKGGGQFLLYEGSDPTAPAMSQLRRDNGIDAEGFACRGYPNPLCPIRVETTWAPICSASGPCENTRTVKIQARVILNTGEQSEEWAKEATISPNIRVSAAVSCERGGGVWALTECLTHEQAAQRQIASGQIQRHDARDLQQLAEAPRVVCEPDIVIQGNTYPVDFTAENRGQVAVPAMNGCPAEDTFIFQCQPKSQDDRYGQWVQIEAKMAPACDEQGNAQGDSISLHGTEEAETRQ